MEQPEHGATSPLRRKMAAAQGDTAAPGRAAMRALRLALARAAADDLDLPLSVIGVRQARLRAEDLEPCLGGDRLRVLLDGQGGLPGAVVLDRAPVAGLIRQQTMGAVTRGEVDDRPFTGTDAAMAAPLIDGMLERAPALAEAEAGLLCGFRFGAMAETDRAVLLALVADRYRRFVLTVDLGGVMQGEVALILPEPAPDPADSGAEAGRDGDAAPQPDRGFGGLRVELDATLCRLRLPLAEFAALRPGDLVPLAMPDGLARTALVAISGDVVSFGRLGRINGMRAVRINETREAAKAPSVSDPSVSDPPLPETDAFEPEETRGEAPQPPNRGVKADGLEAMADSGETDTTLPAELDDTLLDLTSEAAMAEISELAGLDAKETGDRPGEG